MSRRLRVALVTELFLPSRGGQEHRFARLAEALVARGADVTVYCIAHRSDVPPTERINGVTVKRLVVAPRYTSPRGPWPRSPLAMLRFAARSRRELKRQAFDFVYFNQWPYLHIASAPKYVRQSAAVDWCEWRDGIAYYGFQSVLPRLVNTNVAINSRIAERLRQTTRRSAVLIPSGTDTAQYDSPPMSDRPKDILYLGRLVEHKQIPLLIRAFAHVDAGHLHIAGSGPDEGAVQESVRALPPDVRARVHLHGSVSEKTKRALLASASCLVIPSRREGFPNVVAESVASGTPVVTVDSPENGTTTVVRELGIGLVTPDDERELAAGLMQMLKDRSQFHQRCLASRPSVDWSQLGDLFHDTVLSAPAGGARRKDPAG